MSRPGLLVAAAGSLIQLVLVLFGFRGPARVASGILFTSLWPGYALLAALTRPKENESDALEQFVLAVPLSLAVSIICGLVLNSSGAGVNPMAQAIGMTTLVLALCGTAWLRQTWLGRAWKPSATMLAGTLAVAVVAGVWARDLELPPGGHEPYFSLYVLNENGQNDRYPVEAAAGTSIPLILGGLYEGPGATGALLVSSDGTSIPLQLEPNREWQAEVELNLTTPGLHRVTWELHPAGHEHSLRSVHLWINVN